MTLVFCTSFSMQQDMQPFFISAPVFSSQTNDAILAFQEANAREDIKEQEGIYNLIRENIDPLVLQELVNTRQTSAMLLDISGFQMSVDENTTTEMYVKSINVFDRLQQKLTARALTQDKGYKIINLFAVTGAQKKMFELAETDVQMRAIYEKINGLFTRYKMNDSLTFQQSVSENFLQKTILIDQKNNKKNEKSKIDSLRQQLQEAKDSVLGKNRNYKKANQILETLAQHNPTNDLERELVGEAWYSLGLLGNNSGKRKTIKRNSKKDFEKAIEHGSTLAILELARLQEKENNDFESYQNLKKFITQSQGDDCYKAERALAYFNIGLLELFSRHHEIDRRIIRMSKISQSMEEGVPTVDAGRESALINFQKAEELFENKKDFFAFLAQSINGSYWNNIELELDVTKSRGAVSDLNELYMNLRFVFTRLCFESAQEGISRYEKAVDSLHYIAKKGHPKVVLDLANYFCDHELMGDALICLRKLKSIPRKRDPDFEREIITLKQKIYIASLSKSKSANVNKKKSIKTFKLEKQLEEKLTIGKIHEHILQGDSISGCREMLAPLVASGNLQARCLQLSFNVDEYVEGNEGSQKEILREYELLIKEYIENSDDPIFEAIWKIIPQGLIVNAPLFSREAKNRALELRGKIIQLFEKNNLVLIVKSPN